MSKEVELDVRSIEMHALAESNAPMTDQQFTAFKNDIELQGVIVPIVMFRKKCVDGRHRCRALRELVEEKTGTSFMIKAIELPWKTSLESVKSKVLGFETRRHQTPTQINVSAWLDAVKGQGLTIREAESVTGVPKSILSRVSSIYRSFGINTVNHLKDGLKVTVIDPQSTYNKRITTDSINALDKFIRRFGELDERLESIKDNFEKKVAKSMLDTKAYFDSLNEHEIVAVKRQIEEYERNKAKLTQANGK